MNFCPVTPAFPQGVLQKTSGKVRWRFHGFRRGPQSGSRNPPRPHSGQISPNKRVKDESLEDSENLSPPAVLALEIMEDPEAALK